MNANVLEKEFKLILQDLIQHHKALGMEASGNWIKSLDVQAKNDSVVMKGVEYTNQLINGTPPGTWVPKENMMKWIKDKNIQSDLKPSILAYLISRKIFEEGTRYFKQKGTDLIDKIFTPERIQKVIDKVSILHIEDFVKLSRGAFNSLALISG